MSGDGDGVDGSFNRSPLSFDTATKISLSNGIFTFNQYRQQPTVVKGVNSETIKVVPLLEVFPDRLKSNHYEVIMTSLHRPIKWSHEGFRYFLIKY